MIYRDPNINELLAELSAAALAKADAEAAHQRAMESAQAAARALADCVRRLTAATNAYKLARWGVS